MQTCASYLRRRGRIDDHSRLLVASRAFATAKAADIVETFHQGMSELGLPTSMLTDNGATFHRREPPKRLGHRTRTARPGSTTRTPALPPSDLRQGRTRPPTVSAGH